MTNTFIFFLGAIFGSFTNLVINRTIKAESIVSPPSHCDSCGHRLHPLDLVPIFSFIFLRGRCKYCKAEIPKENLLVEIISGLLLLIFFDSNSILKSSLLYCGIMLALIIAVIDFKTFDIYMVQILYLSIIGLIYRIKFVGLDFLFIKNILIFSLFYGIIYYFFKGSLGNGDIYYYLALFLFLPNYKLLWFILISLWLGALSGIFIAIKNKSTKIEIPFCIYIFMAFLILSLPWS